MADNIRSTRNGPRVVEFPRSREQDKHPPTNVPLELSSFIGREREVAKVKRLLLSDARLLTLTGTGGCGKTRLALVVARELIEEFKDGVWLVELASLGDPALVPQTIASVLGVREAPGLSLTELLVEHLKPKEMLVVLDNCEHLMAGCTALVDALLRSCKGLRILATSRESLGIAGERIWLVPSLSLPDPRRLPSIEQLARYEAVRLFVERARAVASTFELSEGSAQAVAQLCSRLEGVPLAIELAAARMRMLSVEEILERLEDPLKVLSAGTRTAAPRHRTLRATLAWSYELLSEPEQELFGRLSVFAGGWTLEAAEVAGAGEGIKRDDVLDLLGRLVDKSLVAVRASAQGASRYGMLDPVRQYGLEHLEGSGKAERVRERHAGYYLALAEAAELELEEQEAWLERLHTEHDNLRVALRWSSGPEATEQGGRAELGLRLAAALAQGRFWTAYGVREGREWLERGLARSITSPTSVRAKALNEAGWLAIYQGDYQRAVALLGEGLALSKEVGDKSGAATSLTHLGHMALHGGDHERVRAFGEEAEALRQELTDRRAIGHLLQFLGMAALVEGDRDRAVARLEEGLALNQELGDMRGTAMCLTVLGITALEQGDLEQAAALYAEDMRVLQRLKDKQGIAYGLRGLAVVAGLRGQAARAAQLWGAVEALQEAIGLPLSHFDRSHPDYEGRLAGARSRLGEAAWEAAWSEGRTMTLEEAMAYALDDSTAPQEDDTRPLTTLTTSVGTAELPVEAYPDSLTAREAEVLGLLASGKTNKEIAKGLVLSVSTVERHVANLYRKIGARSRTEATAYALNRGIAEP